MADKVADRDGVGAVEPSLSGMRTSQQEFLCGAPFPGRRCRSQLPDRADLQPRNGAAAAPPLPVD
jgi:hypothetical protein